MILNLSDVLSEQHKAIHESVPIEMTCFKSENMQVTASWK